MWTSCTNLLNQRMQQTRRNLKSENTCGQVECESPALVKIFEDYATGGEWSGPQIRMRVLQEPGAREMEMDGH